MAFTMKRNDTRPLIKAQLTSTDPSDPTNQVPVDLSAATTVKFYMRVAPNTGTIKVSGTATVTDAVNGFVQYTWQAGDTDTSGSFFGEWEVHWGTDLQTFPSDDYIAITIKDDLGP